MWGGFGPGAWWAFGLGFLLRVLLVIGLLVLIWKAITSRTFWHRPDSAMQVLRERFARGEISEDEYRKRLTVLS